MTGDWFFALIAFVAFVAFIALIALVASFAFVALDVRRFKVQGSRFEVGGWRFKVQGSIVLLPFSVPLSLSEGIRIL